VKIGACIIAKNEEKNLPRLLSSLRGKFDEIVLVDTGSEDRTVEIARDFGCKVVLHSWNGFADARNRALDEISSDIEWVWHFDADFELEEEEFRKALMYLKKLSPDVDGVSIGIKSLDSFGNVRGMSTQVFIHRNKASIRWKGMVHEIPSVNFIAGIPVYVKHYGYSNSDILLAKAKRNLELLLKEIEVLEKGSRDYLIKLFYIVQSYTILAYEDKKYLSKVVDLAEEFISYSENRKDLGFFGLYIYNYLLSVLKVLKLDQKYEYYLKKVLNLKPHVPDFYISAFEFYMRKGEKKEAFAVLVRLLELLTSLERSTFSFSSSFATDKVSDLKRLFLSNDLAEFSDKSELIMEVWKRERSKYSGLLLMRLLSNRYEKQKLMKKLLLRYHEDEFAVSVIFWELKKGYDIGYLEDLRDKLRGKLVFYLLEGLIQELKGNLKAAIASYSGFLEKKKDIYLIAHVVSLMKDASIKSKELPPIMNVEQNKLKGGSHGSED